MSFFVGAEYTRASRRSGYEDLHEDKTGSRQWELAEAITEPSAVAPDAKVHFSVKWRQRETS
jgi:hypothetical protein